MNRIEKLKEYLAAQPSDSFLQHALALEYIKLGDDEEARRIFEALLAQNDQYIGSYYHLAKLLERTEQRDAAISWYEKGLQKAKAAGDQHTYNELLAAYEDLIY
jgi:Tfp pilus assembly protein PilF